MPVTPIAYLHGPMVGLALVSLVLIVGVILFFKRA